MLTRIGIVFIMLISILNAATMDDQNMLTYDNTNYKSRNLFNRLTNFVERREAQNEVNRFLYKPINTRRTTAAAATAGVDDKYKGVNAALDDYIKAYEGNITRMPHGNSTTDVTLKIKQNAFSDLHTHAQSKAFQGIKEEYLERIGTLLTTDSVVAVQSQAVKDSIFEHVMSTEWSPPGMDNTIKILNFAFETGAASGNNYGYATVLAAKRPDPISGVVYDVWFDRAETSFTLAPDILVIKTNTSNGSGIFGTGINWTFNTPKTEIKFQPREITADDINFLGEYLAMTSLRRIVEDNRSVFPNVRPDADGPLKNLK